MVGIVGLRRHTKILRISGPRGQDHAVTIDFRFIEGAILVGTIHLRGFYFLRFIFLGIRALIQVRFWTFLEIVLDILGLFFLTLVRTLAVRSLLGKEALGSR